MGQAPSLPDSTRSTRSTRPSLSRSFTTRFSKSTSSRSTVMIHPPSPPHPTVHIQQLQSVDPTSPPDATSSIPDEILSLVFQALPSKDRTNCSLVCKRWLLVEGQNRHRLSLNAAAVIDPVLPSIFSRFDSISKLALRCDRRTVSISDESLIFISQKCRSLTRLKLRGCREITDLGIAAFAENCGTLRKLSVGSCVFGVAGINSVLQNCPFLEEISIKRLRGINRNFSHETVWYEKSYGHDVEEVINPGNAALSLKSICLKELYNGQLFLPLIVAANNLRILKLIRCLGDWDGVLETLGGGECGNGKSSLVEVHLERIQVTDVGLCAISRSLNLEVLHLVKTPECTNLGLVSIGERCKLLRKVHIDGWRANRIGDEGLSVLGKNCTNLQELVLIGLNPTILSLGVIASNCKGLERLAMCSSDTIGDVVLSCIASKCVGLKKFCIKSCPISDNGLDAFAWGCPNLIKIKVRKCKLVTMEGIDWLRVKRESLIVEMNVDGDEVEPVDASASDAGGGLDDGLVLAGDETEVAPVAGHVRNNGRGGSLLGVFFRRNVAACALRRWSSGGGSANASQ